MNMMDHLFPEEMIVQLTQRFGPREMSDIESTIVTSPSDSSGAFSTLKTGWITFIGMAMHNAPEGVAVYLGTMKSKKQK